MSNASARCGFLPGPLHIPAYKNPDSASPLHFCLVSESSTSVEGPAGKMVSNSSADDVASTFPLSLPVSLPLSVFLNTRWIKQPGLCNSHKALAEEFKVTDSTAALTY